MPAVTARCCVTVLRILIHYARIVNTHRRFTENIGWLVYANKPRSIHPRKPAYSLATPLFLAASATAFATALPTLGSNALGIM